MGLDSADRKVVQNSDSWLQNSVTYVFYRYKKLVVYCNYLSKLFCGKQVLMLTMLASYV